MDSHINNDSSRTAATEHDEGADQADNDTPRSGFATPEPDPQDKRLPGIMSYFGQVSRSSFTRLWSGTSSAATEAAVQSSSTAPKPQNPEQEQRQESPPPSSQLPVSPPEPASRSSSEGQGPPLLPHEKVGKPSEDKPSPEGGEIHPYPTPPASSRSSLRGAKVGESSGEGARQGAAVTSVPSPNLHKPSVTDLSGLKGRRPSVLAPMTSVQVTESNVHACHFSNPGSRRVSTSQNSPVPEHFASVKEGPFSEDPASVRRLKELTNEAASKSGQSTPNRSLSTAQPARHDGQDERRTSDESSSATGTQTPSDSSAVPTTKGKLTIKISEARGLRKCRAPYVIAVFQRSELISGTPREEEEDEETAVSNVAMGGVPIQRQASDSGRPMAIPMRSRQSSNTSTGEFNSFRNRNQRRSFTNPKWDAEAVL